MSNKMLVSKIDIQGNFCVSGSLHLARITMIANPVSCKNTHMLHDGPLVRLFASTLQVWSGLSHRAGAVLSLGHCCSFLYLGRQRSFSHPLILLMLVQKVIRAAYFYGTLEGVNSPWEYFVHTDENTCRKVV